MAAILQQIGAPLQLAALLLLLVAGIARLLVRSGTWKPTPGVAKLIVDRLFQASVAALVAGVVAATLPPVLDKALNGDATYRGAVLSTTGETIANATVDVIGVAAVGTNALGQFEIVVPRNRVAKEYRLQISASGYETLVEKGTAQELGNLEVRLTPAIEDIVKSFDRQILIGQFYGYPFVIISLRAENSKTDAKNFVVRARLTHDGTALELTPAFWSILYPYNTLAPVTGPFPLPAGVYDFHILLATGEDFSEITRRIRTLTDYKNKQPCVRQNSGAVDPLTPAAYKLTKEFATEHFAWRDGDWHLQVELIADNRTKSFTRDFTLTKAEKEQLLASIALLRQCQPPNLAAPFAQDGPVANYITKEASSVQP
jgi:hypothetical protein